MRQIGIVIAFFLAFKISYPSDSIDFAEHESNVRTDISENLIEKADNLYQVKNFEEALVLYSLALENSEIDKPPILKKMALSYASLYNSSEAVYYLQEYLFHEFNIAFLGDDGFATIKNTNEFIGMSEKYVPKLSFISFIYFYVALIGFYIAVMINLNKKTDRIAKILISSFVFIHSFFIFHICFNLTNYHFVFPHSYRMSTPFSLLYGPLLFFYFKRITQQYKFKKRDLLHLFPTILLILYLNPVYSLPINDKLGILLERANGGVNVNHTTYTTTIVLLKLVSLLIYGYFIRKIYLKSKAGQMVELESRIWQRNIYFIHFSYIVVYAIYGILIINNQASGFFYHSQIVCMGLMVMYIGYSVNVQPKVFNGSFSLNKLFYKYEKSGLTESLSLELKENLIHLFDTEKIYKESNICLDRLSEKLNTTRHNTSQVINEHFKMSFHELINTYRIQEAKAMLNSDTQRNLNIIDIAYEVGYNNKVTFNKAFKKDTELTPSQYQRIEIRS